MIPVLSSVQLKELDEYTIKNTPIESVDLMERAAVAVFYKIVENFDKSTKFSLFCGMGNNGGDGLAISRLLLNNHYRVKTYIVKSKNIGSEDFEINLKRLKETNFSNIIELTEKSQNFEIDSDEVIIDAIFGTGLSYEAKGFTADIIHKINSLNLFTIAIDVPSGLSADIDFFSIKDPVIKADICYSFQYPKLCFFLPETAYYCGDWELLNIKILNKPLERFKLKNFVVTQDFIKSNIYKRDKFSHKGNFGHALLVAGSKNTSGAALLSAKACIRSGCGLLSCHCTSSVAEALRVTLPEAMFSIDDNKDFISSINDIEKFNSIAIGPGIGTSKQTENALKLLIQNSKIPLILDADAINILSNNKTWISFLAEGSILTPHPKEFIRLFGDSKTHKERLELQRAKSIKHQVYIILKGAHTCITTPEGNAYFNSTGNPGMATAGSGDVLTGIICGLLAQSYSSLLSSIIGVYIHGLAGDIALSHQSVQSLIASDIVDNIGNAYNIISNKKRADE